MSTLVVSWKEAADRNESVASEALVMPRMISSNSASSFLAFFSAAFASIISLRSTNWPGR